ncbi:MAG TPA: MBL fold metallo-hydrolase [Ginsengibacter sp.]|nr:MBL fold metallo-hydrolase [Ginsengibacter sp.]
MSLFVTSLNSGSNGNCYYIGNENEAILVDAGISCRETEKRMKRLRLHIDKVKAIFISHEHSDHIKGLETLSKKYQLPVYITNKTLYHCGNLKIEKSLLISFEAYQNISFGNLSVIPFFKLHDAADPHSFIIECNKIKVGVFTDIGSSCEHVIKNFQQCDAAFLEANYDEKMLNDGAYPYHLKKRISGGLGHLSNTQALELFLKYKPSFMSHLFLSHLSKNNNTPQLVQDLFNSYAGEVEIIVASRFEETAVYHIQNVHMIYKTVKPVQTKPQQLSFSFA